MVPKSKRAKSVSTPSARDLSKVQNLEIWQGMLDQLNLGEMPPKKEPQPSRRGSQDGDRPADQEPRPRL